ncbi:MAG: hypothetical protein QNJ15_06220 [Erythrobacter sp.]|nr:hypothetical protein [Erythrobacter sp.]
MNDPRKSYDPHLSDLWPDAKPHNSVDSIPLEARGAYFNREKNSHRGIRSRIALKGLVAGATNQEFLEEICELHDLEYLDLAWPTTAKDLAPLTALTKLRVLKIDSPRNIADFTPLLDLPRLDTLIIENAKHLFSLDWLRPFATQLKVLGIEGSMYTTQQIESLSPIAEFDLVALFLTSTRLHDLDLKPLHGMKNLRLLGTALNAPRAEFAALEAALPDLDCSWFDPAAWEGFRDPRKPKSK